MVNCDCDGCITHVGDGTGGGVWHLLRLIRESEALITRLAAASRATTKCSSCGERDGVFLIEFESKPKQPTGCNAMESLLSHVNDSQVRGTCSS